MLQIVDSKGFIRRRRIFPAFCKPGDDGTTDRSLTCQMGHSVTGRRGNTGTVAHVPQRWITGAIRKLMRPK
jgi:hypothetical protein